MRHVDAELNYCKYSRKRAEHRTGWLGGGEGEGGGKTNMSCKPKTDENTLLFFFVVK